MEPSNNDEANDLRQNLKDRVTMSLRLYRYLGLFGVLASQVLHAKALGEGGARQFSTAIAMGNLGVEEERMAFGAGVKLPKTPGLPGWGVTGVRGQTPTLVQVPWLTRRDIQDAIAELYGDDEDDDQEDDQMTRTRTLGWAAWRLWWPLVPMVGIFAWGSRPTVGVPRDFAVQVSGALALVVGAALLPLWAGLLRRGRRRAAWSALVDIPGEDYEPVAAPRERELECWEAPDDGSTPDNVRPLRPRARS